MLSKIMVIGLDGGTWKIYDRLMGQGLMPNLKQLTITGYRSDLLSTIPILTPAAWTTFATGTNPGKHGVMGFMAPQETPGEYSCPLPRSTTVATKTLWRILAEHGLKPTVLQVPLTYPPEPIHGNILSGMFTPGPESHCTEPRSLKQELQALDCLGPFEILLPETRGKTQLTDQDYSQFFQDIERYTENLCRSGLHMMKKAWDFFMIMFLSNDRFQHALWHKVITLDESNDDYISHHIRSFYRRLDEIVGLFVEAAGDNCTTLIMSDHGFGPCHGRFNLGRWFLQNGYLTYRSHGGYQRLKKLVRKIGFNKLIRKTLSSKRVAHLKNIVAPLDWSKTKAFPTVGGIQINLKGREKCGIVDPADYQAFRDTLREKLTDLTDSAGRNVFGNLWYPEEIYTGDYVPFARDIIMQNADDPSYEFYMGSPQSPPVEAEIAYRGNHRAEGIFVAHGQGIVTNPSAPPAHISDLAPTILWHMGLDIPDNMDGKVIQDAFTSPSLIRYTSSAPDLSFSLSASTSIQHQEEEQSIIKNRLKNIGYLE